MSKSTAAEASIIPNASTTPLPWPRRKPKSKSGFTQQAYLPALNVAAWPEQILALPGSPQVVQSAAVGGQGVK